jgi:hypothetical protein
MELTLCPFERRIAGPRGTVIARHNREHMELSRVAIQRRSHPAWSRFVDEVRAA